MKLAAIDIGSNAARLLISEVYTSPAEEPRFTKIALVRVPLRLGFDVFASGRIPSDKIEKVLKTIQSYKFLLDVYEVDQFKACATSAMRDAQNGQEIIARVKKETGIEIEIISGQQEATYIYHQHAATAVSPHLYIDVGGGSTELTLYVNDTILYKESFNIGTIRLLKNQVEEKTWQHMKDCIKSNVKGIPNLTAVGSGGNINKIFSLSKRKEGKPLSIDLLKDYYKEFNQQTVEQRIKNYNLKEDRADVIVPALLLYINVMKWANINEILVPKIGLADGIIQHLYEQLEQ